MKKTNTKRALGMSLISLLACGVMFAGSTYAWFTDEVVASGNKIESGTLKADMEVFKDEQWVSLKENPETKIFDYDKWEPGYTASASIKILNKGNLGFRYQVLGEFDGETFGPNGESLQNVIDVYMYAYDFTKPFEVPEIKSFAEVKAAADANVSNTRAEGWYKVGTLAEWMALPYGLTAGYMLPEGADYTGTKYGYNGVCDSGYTATVVLHMQEEAGNEYQGLTLGDVNLTLKATQWAWEKDGFGNSNYDLLWDGSVDTRWYNSSATEFVIDTPAEFAGFASIVNGENGLADTFAGKTVTLDADINLNNVNWAPIGDPMADGYVGFEGTFDGNNHTISDLNVNNPSGWGQGLFGYITSRNAVIKNTKVKNVSINTTDTSGAIAGYAYFGTFENNHVTGDVEITGVEHMGGIVGNGYYANFSNCSVLANEGSSITATGYSFVGGIVGYHGEGALKIENCDVKNLELTAYGAVGAITGIAQYSNIITGCTAENVVLNKTGIASLASVGLACGTWTTKAGRNTVITDNSFKNITLNGKYIPASGQVDILFGSNYSNVSTNNEGTFDNNVFENIVNNLELAAASGVKTSAAFVSALTDDSIEEIELKDDIVLTEDLTIAAGREVTIHLNGKTLDVTSSATTTSALLINKGELVIEGKGNVVYESSKPSASYGYSTSTIVNSGKLTINGGNFINETIGGASYVIDNAPGAELTINDGYFYNNGITIRAYSMDGYAANNVVINGGEFVSEGSRVLQSHLISSTNNKTAPVVNITINGGTFTTNDEEYNIALYSYSVGTSMANVTFTLNGGTFNGDIALDGGAGKNHGQTVIVFDQDACTFNGYVYRYITADPGYVDLI